MMSFRFSFIKNTSIFFILPLTILSCGKKEAQNIVPQIQVDNSKVYFVTSDVVNKTSSFYAFNPQTKNLDLMPLIMTSNIGVKAFQSRDDQGNLSHLYLTEDLSNSPARVTYFHELNDVFQDTTNFPQNIKDMMIENGKLYTIGFDKKEIAQSDLNLKMVPLPKTTIQTFDPSDNYDEPNNFYAFLAHNSQFYVVTKGQVNMDGKYEHIAEKIPAKLYSLNTQNLVSAPTSNIEIQADGQVCYDVSSSLKVSNSFLLVNCNPSWTKDLVPVIFSIDVSSSQPIVHVYKVGVQGNEFTLGGLSQDKLNAFVTEDNGDYNNPKVVDAWWLNARNASQIKEETQAAYQVSYNKMSNSYVFSCAVDQNSKTCVNNTFALSSSINNGSIHGEIQFFELNSVKNFSQHSIDFFQEL